MFIIDNNIYIYYEITNYNEVYHYPILTHGHYII